MSNVGHAVAQQGLWRVRHPGLPWICLSQCCSFPICAAPGILQNKVNIFLKRLSIKCCVREYVCLCVLSCLVELDSSQAYGLQPTRLLCPGDFPGENTGDGCHLLLQGIFLTQGLNPPLLCLLQADSLPLSHWGLDEHYFYFTSGKVRVIKYHVQIQRLKKKDLLRTRFSL